MAFDETSTRPNSPDNHWKADALLKGGDDMIIRKGGWCVRDSEVGDKHDNQPSNNT